MKRKTFKIFLALLVLASEPVLFGQMPNFFGTPAGAPTTSGGAAKSSSTSGGFNEADHPRDPQTGQFIPKTTGAPTGGEKTTTGGEKTTAGGEKASQQQKPQQPAQQQPAGPAVPKYDPYMDNHLKAPEADKPVGLFGLPVKQVEDMLKFQGAKNHSYAFGKYSRLTMSAYLVTIYFDKQRKVGGFLIEPRQPYKTVAPGAREFFLDTFLKGADMSKFAVKMSSDRLEVTYAP